MADDQQPREDVPGKPAGHRDATSAGGDSGGGDAPAGGSGVGRPAPDQSSQDQTREFDPFAEPDEPEPTRSRSDGAEPDRPGDRTQAYPSGGQTAPLPGHGRWSGRAEVPRPGAGGGVREAVPAEWEQEEAGAGPRWWLPIVIAVVLLLGVLGAAVWLALRADGQQPGTPAATTPVVPTTTAAPTTAPATSAAPSTPASPTPSATGAAVTVPPLVRQDETTARAILDDLGLQAVTQTRESDTVPPGRVIETDPEAGTPVSPGATITLIIATAPPTTAPPSTRPAESTPGSTGAPG